MEVPTKDYVVRNCLTYAYDALRSRERLMGDSTESYYEKYFVQLSEALGPPGKRWELAVPNSEVESFYLGNMSVGEFRLQTQKRVLSKIPGWEFPPFSSVIWSVACSAPDKASLCSRLDSGISRQIWEIFVSLDVDSQGKLHIDDLCDLIQRIFIENGHVETEQNIKEWFCEEKLIDFWSFFAAIVENYSGLLKPNIIRSLHELVFSEILLCGKLTKKGHKIHSWRERWFMLQPTQLSYYESFENMILKGTVAIGGETQFEFLPDSKSHHRRFKIIDYQTQVPYEICTPDVTSLQQWNYGIQVAVAMNRVTGSNFLHKLTQAQKQVFPENSTFSISAVAHMKSATPTSIGFHPPLSPSKSAPIAKVSPQPPLPYGQHKAVAQLKHQASVPGERRTPNDDEIDGPPPIPPQKFNTGSGLPQQKVSHSSQQNFGPAAPGVVVRQNPRDPSSLAVKEAKARRRHSSINYSSEFEKEQERERDKLEHFNVAGAMYAVVKKPNSKNGGPPELPEKGAAREIRRIRPKTPSPNSQRRGYVQLQFQNGMHSSNPAPLPKREMLPPPARTKWSYSTVVFEAQAKQREDLDNDLSPDKKNKPLPPTPGSFKSSVSDPNILAPQPVARKKPQSLADLEKPISQPRRGLDYADIDFSPQTPTQNGNLPGGGKPRKEKPKLPPKEDDIAPGKPRLPPKQDSITMEKPKLPPKQDSTGTEKPRLPPKEESLEIPPQSQTPTRPIPAPRRIVSPSSEVPPPIPARRSPLPPP